MAKVNYSAQTAGIEMNTLIGILTTGQEVSQQAPEAVGTAWRTIISRMQNVKAGKYTASNVEQASSDYDESEYEALNDVEAVLRKAGISMRTSANTWKDSEQVLNEIAAKWSGLSDVTKSAIATSMAGTRQREYFIAAMSNWDQVSAYAKIASQATGTAAQKMLSYTNSVEAAKNRITSAWENLALSLNQSDTMAYLYNTIADILNNIGYFALGAIGPVIAQIVMNVQKNGNPFIQTVAELKQRFSDLSKTVEQVDTKIKQANGINETPGEGSNQRMSILQRAKNSKGMNIAGSIASVAGAASGAMGASAAGDLFNWDDETTAMAEGVASTLPMLANSINPLFGLIVGAVETAGGLIVTAVNNARKEAIEEAAENYQEAKASRDELLLNGESAADVIEKYRYGVNGQTGANVSLTDEEYEEFLEASDTLLGSVDGLDKVYNSEGKAIIKIDSLDNTMLRLNGTAGNLIDVINKQITDDEQVMNESLTEKNTVQQAINDFEDSYEEDNEEDKEDYINERINETNRFTGEYTADQVYDANGAVYQKYLKASESGNDYDSYEQFLVSEGILDSIFSLYNDLYEQFEKEYDDIHKLPALIDSMSGNILGYLQLTEDYQNLSEEQQELISSTLLNDTGLLNVYDDPEKLQEYIEQFAVIASAVFDSEAYKNSANSLEAITSASTVGEQENLISDLNDSLDVTLDNVDETTKSIYEGLGFTLTESQEQGQYILKYSNSIFTQLEEAFGEIASENQSFVRSLSIEEGNKLLTLANKYGDQELAISRFKIADYGSDALTSANTHMGRAAIQYDQFLNQTDRYKEFLKKYGNQDLTNSQLSKLIVEDFGYLTEEGVESVANAVENIDTTGIEDAIDDLSIQFRNEITTSYQEQAAALASKYFSSLNLDDNGTLSSWKGFSEIIDQITSDFDKLKEAQSEQTKRGKLSWETISDLITSNEEYIDLLEVEDGQVRLRDDYEQLMIKHEIEAMRSQVSAKKDSLATEIESLREQIKTGKAEEDAQQQETQEIISGAKAYELEADAISDTTQALIDLTDARLKDYKLQQDMANDAVDFTAGAYEIDYTTKYSRDSQLDSDELESIEDAIESSVTLDDDSIAALEAELATAENEYSLITQMADSLSSDNFGDDLYDYWMNNIASSSSNAYDEVSKLKDMIDSLNKEFEQMKSLQADTNANAIKDYKYMNENYYKLKQQYTTELMNEYYQYAQSAQANKNWEEYYEYLQLYQDTYVELNNLDDEREQDLIDTYEALGLCNDIVMEQYENLLKTADTVQERIEYENKVIEAQQKQAELADSMLSTYQDLISYKQEYLALDSDQTDNTQLYSDSIDAYQKSAELNMSLAEQAYNRAKQNYLENGGTDELADYYASNDADFQSYLQKAVTAYKAIGTAKVAQFDSSISLLEEQISDLEFNKPDEWELDAEGGMSNITDYYQKVIELYTQEVQLCSQQLNDTADLTDEQINNIKSKGQDALEKISEAQKSSLEEQIALQEEVYEALEWQVNEYISALEEQKEVVTDIYDTEIDKLTDKNKAIERTNKLLELQNNLQNAQEEKKRVYRSGIGWVYETDKSAVKKAQQEIDDFYRQDQVDDLSSAKDKELEILDDSIENWQNYLKMLQEKYESYDNQYKQHLVQSSLNADSQKEVFDKMTTDMEQYTESLQKWKDELCGTGDESSNDGIFGKVSSGLSGMISSLNTSISEALNADDENSLISKQAQFNRDYNSVFNTFLQDYDSNKQTLAKYKTEVESSLDLGGPIETFMNQLKGIDSEENAKTVQEALNSNNIPEEVQKYLDGFKTAIVGEEGNSVVDQIISKINGLIDKIQSLRAQIADPIVVTIEEKYEKEEESEEEEELTRDFKQNYLTWKEKLKEEEANNTWRLEQEDMQQAQKALWATQYDQQMKVQGLYANGIEEGPVTYTGLAMLHGTPSNPEYVLNSDQAYNLLRYLASPNSYSSTNQNSDSSTNYNINGNIVLENCNDPAKFWQDVTTAMSNRFNVTKTRK